MSIPTKEYEHEEVPAHPKTKRAYRWTEEGIAKRKKGHAVTPEAAAKISAAQKGKPKGPQSPKHRANLAKFLIGRKLSKEHKQKLRWQTRTEQTKQNMRDAYQRRKLWKDIHSLQAH